MGLPERSEADGAGRRHSQRNQQGGFSFESTAPDTRGVGEQLRQRREASLRLPPLPCGHRDPMDCDREEWPPPRSLDNRLAAARQVWRDFHRLGLESELTTAVLRDFAKGRRRRAA